MLNKRYINRAAQQIRVWKLLIAASFSVKQGKIDENAAFILIASTLHKLLNID
jgi:hypothetical protein